MEVRAPDTDEQTLFRDTIYALSSGALPAGVAVVRMSGPGTRAALEVLAGEVPAPRRARLSAFRDRNGALLDRGLCLFFPGPASFTGEDCGELHVHGGRAVVAAMMEALGGLPDFRHAESGEFTRRAFVNGKMALTGAEALADLIDAETDAQRRFALANAEAGHGELYEAWRKRLIEARALIEAELDFADEEDVPDSAADSVWMDVAALKGELEAHAGAFKTAEIIREGYRVVILGAPNSGKSSLLNALARRDAAIVTDEPGTTRDVIEVALDIGGAKVIVTDTAGIRDNPGRVEAIGISRAMDHAERADLVVALEDLSAPVPVRVPDGRKVLRVGSKTDLICADRAGGRCDCAISVETGEGLAGLLEVLGREAAAAVEGRAETLPFRVRHVTLLEEAAGHLRTVLGMDGAPLELRAEELRLAANALGCITGSADAEDLLDAIFARFCIGK